MLTFGSSVIMFIEYLMVLIVCGCKCKDFFLIPNTFSQLLSGRRIVDFKLPVTFLQRGCDSNSQQICSVRGNFVEFVDADAKESGDVLLLRKAFGQSIHNDD